MRRSWLEDRSDRRKVDDEDKGARVLFHFRTDGGLTQVVRLLALTEGRVCHHTSEDDRNDEPMQKESHAWIL